MLSLFRNYSLNHLRKDIISGFIVGIVALPLGMAFAIASGVKPEYGLYTTITAGILISLFGGSRFQIGGPTGAFIPILFAVVNQYGYENLLIAGMLAGVFLVLMGILRLGTLIKFIPRPVTIGFTTGIAVTIFAGQITNFLGLHGVVQHKDFISNMREILIHLNTVNIYSVIVAVICLATIVVTPKLLPKVPGPLVGLIVSTITATFLFGGKIATIGSTFGNMPGTLPELHIPTITFQKMIDLIRPAFVIAILGGIESLLSAVVADGMTGTRHNSNKELIGQGIANIITPLFGGIPATGAIARTATNIRTGATSPVSGVVHGLVVLAILLIFAPYASVIPLASLAPVLMIVSWNMSQRKVFLDVLKTRTYDSLVLAVTFFLTVFANLTAAVEIGLILAIILFVKRMSELMVVAKVLPDDNYEKVKPEVVLETHDCPQVSIFNIEGPIFFGAAQMFESYVLNAIKYQPKILILRLGKVPYIDTTGEYTLSGIIDEFHNRGGIVLVSGLRTQPKKVFEKTGLYDKIGQEHFFEHTGNAIDYALKKLETNKCLGCKHNAFKECENLSKYNTALTKNLEEEPAH